MEFIFEKIYVPQKHSFITRRLKMDPKSAKIHSHKNFEINLITSGSGRRIVGNHISSYAKGDLVLLGPDIAHCWEILETDDNEEPECIVTHFYENLVTSDFIKIPELEPVAELLKKAGSGILFKGSLIPKVSATLKRMVTLNHDESNWDVLSFSFIVLFT